MISAIIQLLGGILGLLATVLPGDPFADYIQTTQAMATGIAWLNWCLPVMECASFLFIWIGVMIAWRSIQLFLMRTIKFGDKAIG